MSVFSHSLVMLCPAEHKAAIEAAGVALGYSGNEYTVPLSPTGAEPATHYGLHTWAVPELVYAWTEAPELPPLTPERVTWLRSTLTISARDDVGGEGQDTPGQHFDAVCASIGVQLIKAEI
ncbi:MAG: hypothetical protein HC900_10775 [Methylacidiphilales bacterium]|nr:hypothetical protein [Candidatus Methylacidiphilales bacterium]